MKQIVITLNRGVRQDKIDRLKKDLHKLNQVSTTDDFGAHWTTIESIEETPQQEIVYVFIESVNGMSEEVLVTRIESLANKWVNAFLRDHGYESIEDYDNNGDGKTQYQLFETVIRKQNINDLKR